MTLRTFARRTGWPYAELLQLRWTECNELLALFGLRLQVTPLRVRKPRRRPVADYYRRCPDCGSLVGRNVKNHCGFTRLLP